MTAPSDASQAVELPDFSDLHEAITQYGQTPPSAEKGHKRAAILATVRILLEDHAAAAIAQDRAARAQAEPVARVVRRCNPRPILPATMRLDWLPSADALPDGEYGLYAAPVMPASWVPCTITYVEGEDPEEVAFGPQRMMDRLKKWLTSYFEHVYAERYPAARAQGAGEAVAASQDAEMLHGAHEVIRIWNERARKFGFDGVAGMLNAFRHGEAGSTAPTIPQAAEVPGFVLVPREPTSAMQRAAEEAYRAWSAAEVPDSTFMHSDSYRAMIAAAPTPTASAPKAEGEARLWLWKNGDHYLAFEHLYPCFTPGGDPMTLGEPAGVAIFKRSFDRKADRTREGGDVELLAARVRRVCVLAGVPIPDGDDQFIESVAGTLLGSVALNIQRANVALVTSVCLSVADLAKG